MKRQPEAPVYELAKTTAEAYAKLIPDEALPVGDPRYVPLDKVRGHVNIADFLRQRIKSQEAVLKRDPRGKCLNESMLARLLLTGHQGCGKTTELFRLRELLEGDGFTVVYYDVAKEFDLFMRDIGWWNVVLETVWQLDDQLADSGRGIKLPDAPKEEAAEWIAKIIVKKENRTEIEARLETELGAEAGLPFFVKVKAALKSLMRTGSTYLTQVETEAERRPDTLLRALAEIVRSINEQLHSKGKPGLVVIIDGLEKMPLRADAVTRITSHEAMFIHNGDKLKSPPCHILYTFPLTLLSTKSVAQVYPDEPAIMPVVHVVGRDGKPDDEGVSVMTELADRRVAPGVLGDGVPRTLALASGGHVRDFVRLTRMAASRFGQTIRIEHAEAAIQEMIDYYDLLYAERYRAALISVHREQRLPRGDFDSELIDKLLVLPYQNGERWCALHPCVLNGPRLARLHKDTGSGGKSASRSKHGKGRGKSR
jgi:hypothetical protein